MKTMIISTPIGPRPNPIPPVGSLSIISYLQKRGIEDVEFFHIDGSRPSFDDAVNHIIESRPRILGISAVVSTAYDYTKRLANSVKEALPDILIVVGGNLAASAEVLLRRTAVDICVLGEGEKVFLNLIRRAATTSDVAEFGDIPGLMFLGKDGNLVNTGYESVIDIEEIYDVNWTDLARVSDIDNYIYPAFSGDAPAKAWIAHHPRSYEVHRREKRVIFFVPSKGCVAKCTFCHRWDKGIRHIPVDIVISRLVELIETYNVGFVRVGGETFGEDKRWTKEFCEKIKPLDLLWEASGLRASSVTPEWIATYADAGCISLVFGNETGSERMLQIMEKKVKLSANYDVLRWTVDAGLWTGVSLVVGMPGETPETIEETITFCEQSTSIAPVQNPNDMSINFALALPGTPLYEFGRHQGLIGRGVEGEEQYLVHISDLYANDEFESLNFTDYPSLECLSWRHLINIRCNANYVRKFGQDHYRKTLVDGGYLSSGREDAIGLLYHRRNTSAEASAEKVSEPANDGTDQPEIPGLWSLAVHGKFGLAMICHPLFFYRIRRFLWIFVLVKAAKNRGLGTCWRLFWEYAAYKLKQPWWQPVFRYEYKSLRRIVDQDLKGFADTAAEMVPLRKGR